MKTKALCRAIKKEFPGDSPHRCGRTVEHKGKHSCTRKDWGCGVRWTSKAKR